MALNLDYNTFTPNAILLNSLKEEYDFKQNFHHFLKFDKPISQKMNRYDLCSVEGIKKISDYFLVLCCKNVQLPGYDYPIPTACLLKAHFNSWYKEDVRFIKYFQAPIKLVDKEDRERYLLESITFSTFVKTLEECLLFCNGYTRGNSPIFVLDTKPTHYSVKQINSLVPRVDAKIKEFEAETGSAYWKASYRNTRFLSMKDFLERNNFHLKDETFNIWGIKNTIPDNQGSAFLEVKEFFNKFKDIYEQNFVEN